MIFWGPLQSLSSGALQNLQFNFSCSKLGSVANFGYLLLTRYCHEVGSTKKNLPDFPFCLNESWDKDKKIWNTAVLFPVRKPYFSPPTTPFFFQMFEVQNRQNKGEGKKWKSTLCTVFFSHSEQKNNTNKYLKRVSVF